MSEPSTPTGEHDVHDCRWIDCPQHSITPTGEPWAAEQCAVKTQRGTFHCVSSADADWAVADHNAALAAKRKRGEVGKFIIDQEREIQQLRKQLAAERERYRDVTNALGLYPAPVHEKVIAFIQQLRTELAAERELKEGK